MYLNQLSNNSKDLFMDLCIYASFADNILLDEEKRILDNYCKEMDIKTTNYKVNKSFDEVLDELKQNCSVRDLNIILVEIIALILSDNEYNVLEKEFVQQLQRKLNITDSKVQDVLFAIRHLSEAYTILNEVLDS